VGAVSAARTEYESKLGRKRSEEPAEAPAAAPAAAEAIVAEPAVTQTA